VKIWRVIAASLLLCLVLFGAVACNAFGGGQDNTTQLFEVVRGDLVVSVSGSGSISATREAKLTFGTSGRIDRLLVAEGDGVAEGEVLTRLETGPLELALAQAEAGQAQAGIAQSQAQIAQVQAQAARTQAEAALAQAQANRTQAQIALDEAEDNLEDAEDYLDRLRRFLAKNDSSLKDAEAQFETARLGFEAAQSQLEAADLQVEAAKLQLEIAGAQLDLVEPQLEAADLQVRVAELALAEAEKQLERATITAPFAGVVTSVGADEGDTVLAATPVIYLVDLNHMELKAGIDEVDIPGVKLEQRATISLDALPDLELEGEVSALSLTPTVQAGLVVYEVTISFDAPPDSGLRLGMSEAVDIIVSEHSNVLLVPDRAIRKDSQGNTVVKVMAGEQVQERPVVTGTSDGFQTEIISGLSEGEKVVIETQTRAESGTSGFLFGG